MPPRPTTPPTRAKHSLPRGFVLPPPSSNPSAFLTAAYVILKSDDGIWGIRPRSLFFDADAAPFIVHRVHRVKSVHRVEGSNRRAAVLLTGNPVPGTKLLGPGAVYEVLPFRPGMVMYPLIRKPKRGGVVVTPTLLDAQVFPHIFDAIVAHAGYDALVALQGVSRALKAVADARIAAYYAADIATCKVGEGGADRRAGCKATLRRGCDCASIPHSC